MQQTEMRCTRHSWMKLVMPCEVLKLMDQRSFIRDHNACGEHNARQARKQGLCNRAFAPPKLKNHV